VIKYQGAKEKFLRQEAGRVTTIPRTSSSRGEEHFLLVGVDHQSVFSVTIQLLKETRRKKTISL